MSLTTIYRVYIGISLLSWAILTAGDLLTVYSLSTSFDFYLSELFRSVFLSIFFLFTFLAFKIRIGTRKGSNFIEYLWEVFIIGAITILISLFIKFLLFLFDDIEISHNRVFTNFIYHLNIALITVFLANGFYVWKKMILYQKTSTLHIAWHIFEYIALFSILTNFYRFNLFKVDVYLYGLPLFLYGLILSFNLKWVAFLNYKQKWQSILLTLLIIVISSTFLEQIYEQHFGSVLIIDLAQNVFIAGAFSFILLNSFSSLLVLLFNLPTSSVFEQKFGEVMIFQKLSQSIQMGNKEEEVYQILIESSLSTVLADAGWLEIIDEKGNFQAFINKGISEFDVFEIKKVLRKNHVNIDSQPQYIKNIKSYNHAERIASLPFRSLLLIPLSSHNQKLGTLVLLKNLEDGFDKEMVDIIYTFVSQSSIAIKNFRLISEAVANERYKEELKIAREVQKNLLPASMVMNEHVEMVAFSKAADEVGGDYYDIFKFPGDKIAIVIGDVSGKGTSAAFTMAQMKGIFQSLVQLDLPPDEFMDYANKALSKSLEKSSFITLAIFLIDLKEQRIDFARAGHCPPLFYSFKDNRAEYLESKGLGLGIIRNKDYRKHIEKKTIFYKKDDIMLLYTDGIVEAANEEGEEFGFDKLKNVLYLNVNLNIRQLNDKIIEELFAFTGSRNLNDDYTFLVIKFI